MKKTFIVLVPILIVGIISLLIPHNIPISLKRYYMPNKLFGQGDYLRSWIQSDNPAIIKIANQLKTNNEQASIINAYNWLEKNYHYAPDSDISFTNGRITIHNNGQDYWQKPLLTLSIMQQKGGFYGDCEDGSFILTSIINAMGYHNVYTEIGTVSLSSGIYGHAWVIWKKNGHNYLLETTLGNELKQIKLLPGFYSAQFMFNDQEVKEFYASKTNAHPTLTIKAREELIQKLKGGS